MPNQNVSRLLAARGVIAQKVHGLLAKRTGGNFGKDRDTKADGHSRAKSAGGGNRVKAIEGGRDGRDPGAGMLTLRRFCSQPF